MYSPTGEMGVNQRSRQYPPLNGNLVDIFFVYPQRSNHPLGDPHDAGLGEKTPGYPIYMILPRAGAEN